MSQDHRPPRIRTWIFRIALAVIAIAILLTVRYFYYAADHPSTDDAFVQGDTVLISAKISGRVSQVLVEGDQRVTKGQLLVVLDPIDAQIEVERHRLGEIRRERQVEAQNAVTGVVDQAEIQQRARLGEPERFLELVLEYLDRAGRVGRRLVQRG